jgi:threonyl-tRNA synthetase
VLELFPETKLGIGPPIDTGFYYDFDRPDRLHPEDLEKIEAQNVGNPGEEPDLRAQSDAQAEGLAKYRPWMSR